MKKYVVLILCIILATSLLSGCQENSISDPGQESETKQKSEAKKEDVTKFSIGAASPGGGFYMGASAISTVVNNELTGIYEAAVEVTGASANNAALVQAGEIELGMCATETAWEAYNGKFSFEGKKCDKLRSVMPGWGGVYLFITTADSGFEELADLDGKSYSGGPVGSSNEIITNRIFSLLGIKSNLMNLPTADASRSLGDGSIVGFTLAHPAASVSELEATRELKLFTIDSKYEKAFREAYPQYVWLDIPAGYYKALPDGAFGAGLYNMVISSVDQDEEFIYQIVKAVYENNDTIQNIFPQFANESGLDKIVHSTIPYHSGAIKYFEEQGIDVPDELIPPEMK